MNTADDLCNLIDKVLKGIDEDRCYTKDGWWEHSGQVEWGAAKLAELKEAVRAYLDAPEMKDDYDLTQVIPLTHRKTKGIIQDKNFYVTGFVLTQEDGDKCIVDMSAVRWLSMSEFHDLMHPLIESPTKTAPKDEPVPVPVAWISKWSFRFDESIMSEDGVEIPLYTDPPTKTAPMKPMTEEEIEKGIIETGLTSRRLTFYAGVRFAERHHGITDVRD